MAKAMYFSLFILTFIIRDIMQSNINAKAAQKNKPILVIHGGCPNLNKSAFTKEQFHKSLKEIAEKTYAILMNKDAKTAVVEGIKLLENDIIFNAGKGSRFQEDGKIRMSAGLMSGPLNKFSAVINIENVQHPIEIANHLLNHKHSVLAGPQATKFATDKGAPHFDPKTKHRQEEYLSKEESNSGTVGIVALDSNGAIFAGTSTGGIGYETPGRVGDSPTIAGTYASAQTGVSCTGKGEAIVNQAVAPKIVTRVQDGQSLKMACKKTIEEGNERDYAFGFIALDHQGNIVIGETKKNKKVLYAQHNGKTIKTFLNNNF